MLKSSGNLNATIHYKNYEENEKPHIAYSEYRAELNELRNQFDALHEELDMIMQHSNHHKLRHSIDDDLKDMRRVVEIHTIQGNIIERMEFLRNCRIYMDDIV